MKLFIDVKNDIDVIGVIFFNGLLIILQYSLLADWKNALIIAKIANIIEFFKWAFTAC